MEKTIKKKPYEATEEAANWLRTTRKGHKIKELIIVKTSYTEAINSTTKFYCKWVKTNENEWTRTVGKINKTAYEQIKINEATFWNIIYDNIKWSILESLYISIKY